MIPALWPTAVLCIGGHESARNHIHSTLHSLHIAFTVWPMDINDVVHIVRGQKRRIHGLTQASAQKSVYHELEAMYNVTTPKNQFLH